ncbi:ribosome biogenesis regulatory protein homolog [Vespula pensylvanica]|uniref:Ribosome biogenesis regulatory protein n=1 Tax=Vespula pensylvanica TaxID=30213 RepID=A0A834PDC3_VESPE|nr:ribosome biogenesis regulatory protein homolog [Vespula pensylvanica]KAF7435927.1 hypothetical protein H0235_004118 [Vespula pensylvanica]
MDVVNTILQNEEVKSDSKKYTTFHKDVEPEIDLGSLLVSDSNTLDVKRLRSNSSTYLQQLTRDNVQLLINAVWSLPTERVEEAIVAQLPKPQYVLPRTRCIPKPKPLTKWQQFAKEKGIRTNKKNRTKLKWDEELQKWMPRYGYQRTKAAEQKEWLVEVGNDNNPKEDPFTAMSASKRERQSKNELQRLRNIAKSKKVKLPRVGIPTVEHFPKPSQLSTAVTVAHQSTASLGKFQERLPKEKDAKGILTKLPSLKKKAKEIPLNLKDEKEKNKDLVNKILSHKSTILNVDSSPVSTMKRKKVTSKKSKGSKKPKAGKGKRDMHMKVGGRKRR